VVTQWNTWLLLVAVVVAQPVVVEAQVDIGLLR
jgi:hypothetical protein